MSSTYFDALADRWDESVAERDSSKLARLAKKLEIEPGSGVLDVGAGTGVFVPFLLEKVGIAGQIVCLDYSEKMLAKARAKGFPQNVACHCADILETGLESSTFDAVVCYSSFPHFRDKPQACREMYRLLRTGGRLFICHTSSRDRINGIHSGITHLTQDLIPTDGEMFKLLEGAGFCSLAVQDELDSYLATASKP